VENEIKNTEFEVSGDLADKLAELFQAVLSSDPSPSENNDDEKVYYFTTGDYSREFRESEISDQNNYHELVRICQDIANDLQQGNLNESGYIDQINGILEKIRLHTFLG
jgi:hypothetical protein